MNAPLALVLGIVFSSLWGFPFGSEPGKWISLLLKVSVVGLGFGMNVESAIDAGSKGIVLTIGSIIFVLVAGYWVGKWMKMPIKESFLISSGTAICGGSAIAAVAPAVKADGKSISVSLGVVFALNSVALVVFPPLGHLFQMTQEQFGLWCAIAIHDTSSVVGAASAYGGEALAIATTVKLARALWIIPLAILAAWLFKSKDTKPSIPWFIAFFIGALLMNSYLPIPEIVSGSIVDFSKMLLILTLLLIGSTLSWERVKSVGWPPLIQGVILWVAVSILSFFMIY